jgi:hypothetical protein
MNSVFEKLNNLEIYPARDATKGSRPAAGANELTERGIRRAAEQIRQEWAAISSGSEAN